VSEIASHGPAKVEGGSTISRDGPAQVHDRGRRRDGGASFAVVLIENDGEDEGRKTRILRWRYSQRICASAISPTPSVF
jgi:hypothetical protein